MMSKVNQGDKDPLKILVHSTHDAALAGLTATLDVFDERCVLFIFSCYELVILFCCFKVLSSMFVLFI